MVSIVEKPEVGRSFLPFYCKLRIPKIVIGNYLKGTTENLFMVKI